MTFVCGLGVTALVISLGGAFVSKEIVFFKLFAWSAVSSAVMIATSASLI